ncbi:PREDICTED: translation initiation factor IF-2-like, partial [Chinchilla lanigera]|uniref:translation initiation factor IF-2-like n=1 Tax=Chinchilla lanigera TaxID=34839 RepID=UPI0006983BE1
PRRRPAWPPSPRRRPAWALPLRPRRWPRGCSAPSSSSCPSWRRSCPDCAPPSRPWPRPPGPGWVGPAAGAARGLGARGRGRSCAHAAGCGDASAPRGLRGGSGGASGSPRSLPSGGTVLPRTGEPPPEPAGATATAVRGAHAPQERERSARAEGSSGSARRVAARARRRRARRPGEVGRGGGERGWGSQGRTGPGLQPRGAVLAPAHLAPSVAVGGPRGAGGGRRRGRDGPKSQSGVKTKLLGDNPASDGAVPGVGAGRSGHMQSK